VVVAVVTQSFLQTHTNSPSKMAARLGGAGFGRDIATHYSVRAGAVGQPPVQSVTLGRAVDQPPEPALTVRDICCCPCKIVSLVFVHIFRRNLAAIFFYIGVLLSGVGFGVSTYILCFKVDSLLCYVNLAKMVGRYVVANKRSTQTHIFLIIRHLLFCNHLLYVLLQVDFEHLLLYGIPLFESVDV